VTVPTGADSSDTGPARARWLRRLGGALLLAFWLCLLFFPEHPAAHGVIVSLALASAAVTALPRLPGLARGSARDAARAWPYLAYAALLTIAWLAHLGDASTQEYLRQLCFLATVWAVAEGVRGVAGRGVVAVIVGLALIVVQILGPHSVVDALGRPLHYRSIQQWSGYPEIGLLASLGGSACVAIALADRRWRVRVASLLLAGGFAAATIYLLSRFSLITMAIAGAWMAIVAAVAMRSRLAMIVLASGVIGVAGLVLLRADFADRLRAVFVDRSAAVEIRSEGWRIAEAMMRDHPLVGVGPGRFREESIHYVSSGSGVSGGDRLHAYNLILHEGAELGYLGLAAYLAMWARVLWRTLQTVRDSGRAFGRARDGVAALAAHGMLVAFFVRSQSEHFLASLDASFRMLLLLAVLFGLAESVGRRPPE
jgi:O-antigen ligase